MLDKNILDGLEIIELGSSREGIGEKLEKVHIYIKQLYQENKALGDRLAKLEARLNEK